MHMTPISPKCLRCHKDLTEDDDDMFVFGKPWGIVYAIYIDLCDECGGLFEEWMGEGGNKLDAYQCNG